MGFVGKPCCRIRWRVYIHYERSGVCKSVCRVGLDPPLVLGVLWWGKPHLRIPNYHPNGPFPRRGGLGWGSWASRVAASAGAFTYTMSAQVYVNPFVGWVLTHRTIGISVTIEHALMYRPLPLFTDRIPNDRHGGRQGAPYNEQQSFYPTHLTKANAMPSIAEKVKTPIMKG